MDFSKDYLLDESVKKEQQSSQTDKKKRLSDMSNDEKVAYYDTEIEKLKEKIKQAEQKRDRIGSVTKSQRNHALIAFGANFIGKEQLYEWYQLPAKEREKAIKAYALDIKTKAGL